VWWYLVWWIANYPTLRTTDLSSGFNRHDIRSRHSIFSGDGQESDDNLAGRVSGSTQSHAFPQHAQSDGKHFRSHEKFRQGQGISV
jgi:hypothetical protein